jgi:hypothetical protein
MTTKPTQATVEKDEVVLMSTPDDLLLEAVLI